MLRCALHDGLSLQLILNSAPLLYFPPQMPVLVFDLDDTLYPELSYVHSGFRAVAAFLSPLLEVPAETLAAGMIAEEAAQGRGPAGGM